MDKDTVESVIYIGVVQLYNCTIHSINNRSQHMKSSNDEKQSLGKYTHVKGIIGIHIGYIFVFFKHFPIITKITIHLSNPSR